jgi:hypothetical protein
MGIDINYKWETLRMGNRVVSQIQVVIAEGRTPVHFGDASAEGVVDQLV